MRYLIGIDDTDYEDSRGTGYRVRCLGAELEVAEIGKRVSVTRHQLLVDPRIPYTTHNSAVCLVVDVAEGDYEKLVTYCRDYLLRECIPGSDAGLCVVAANRVNGELQGFGQRAKEEVLTQTEARTLSQELKLHLEGLTGDHGGIIGALAAVGLYTSGNDGRFIWSRGVREITGIQNTTQLFKNTDIEEIRTVDGTHVPEDACIDVGTWPRPVRLDGRTVLLVEAVPSGIPNTWTLISREQIRQY